MTLIMIVLQRGIPEKILLKKGESMKHISRLLLINIFCITHISAMNYCQMLKDNIVRMGDMIENVQNVPLIEKLTNILPFRIIASSLKECPGQSMLVLTAIIYYILSHNESVRSLLPIYTSDQSLTDQLEEIDDTLFILAGENADDADDEEDIEDDLLTDNFVFKINHAIKLQPDHSIFL